jgi:hypothetical protein
MRQIFLLVHFVVDGHHQHGVFLDPPHVHGMLAGRLEGDVLRGVVDGVHWSNSKGSVNMSANLNMSRYTDSQYAHR